MEKAPGDSFLTSPFPTGLSGKEGDELSVSLKVEALRDFGPEAVAPGPVDEMKTLLRAARGPAGPQGTSFQRS